MCMYSPLATFIGATRLSLLLTLFPGSLFAGKEGEVALFLPPVFECLQYARMEHTAHLHTISNQKLEMGRPGRRLGQRAENDVMGYVYPQLH